VQAGRLAAQRHFGVAEIGPSSALDAPQAPWTRSSASDVPVELMAIDRAEGEPRQGDLDVEQPVDRILRSA
jgi:hypothetical protein